MRKNKLLLSFIGIILLTVFTFAQPIITISSPADSSIQSSEDVPVDYSVNQPIISCSFSLDGSPEDSSIVSQSYNVLSSFTSFNPDYPHSVHVDGDFLYSFRQEQSQSRIFIYDISDKVNPFEVGNLTNFSSMNNIYSVAKEGNFVYVGDNFQNGFVVVDVSDPANPFQVAVINDTGKFNFPVEISISPNGNFAYVVNDGEVNYLTIVNITDPLNPSVVSSLSNSSSDGANSVVGTENFVYIATWSNEEVRVIDVTDKANPVFVGSLFDSQLLSNGGIDTDNDELVYVASGDAGAGFTGAMVIVNVTDKANPNVVSFYNGTGAGLDNPLKVIYSSNGYVFMSGQNGALRLLDVSDPTNPFLISEITGLGSGYGLDAQDSIAYLERPSGSIQIIDVSSDLESIILSGVAQGGHSLTLTCSDWEEEGQSSHNFQVIIPQFAGQIQGTGELFEILQSSGAGLGTFIQFMGVALPTLILGIMFVGIIVLIGFAIVTVINNVMLKPK